jgi:hypothetical protein
MMKRILLIAILMFGSTLAHADFMFDLSSGYHSRSVGENNDYSIMEHHLFIGMPVAVKEQLYLGVNFTYTSESGGENLKTKEYGARINYYFNADKTFLLFLAFNPIMTVDKNSTSGAISQQESMSGSSYIAGLGYETKINNNLFMGATIVYHSATIDDGTKSANSETKYTSINPMINFSFRFK